MCSDEHAKSSQHSDLHYLNRGDPWRQILQPVTVKLEWHHAKYEHLSVDCANRRGFELPHHHDSNASNAYLRSFSYSPGRRKNHDEVV
jgi:hypothetical protein